MPGISASQSISHRAGFSSRRSLRIGFVPLIDASPLIAAAELGYFADEGLDVQLQRQIGWGNLRDKLTFGELDAAHTLIGMPLFSVLKVDWFVQPLVVLMNLGSGGDAITVSKRIVDRGVESGDTLAAYIKRLPAAQRLIITHVFCCSMHHYLVRRWLSSASIDPDQDVSLGVLPPQQMARHMGSGYIDAFCVGEPYNTVATSSGFGRIVIATTDIVPSHPEKALVVTRPWGHANRQALPGLIRAILRGCEFCGREENWNKLSRMLAAPGYLNIDPKILLASLRLTDSTGQRVRCMTPACTFPSGTHHLWLLREMVRWGHAAPVDDPMSIVRQCIDSEPYRSVAGDFLVTCPPDDFPDMPVCGGVDTAAAIARAIASSIAARPSASSAGPSTPDPTRSFAGVLS